MPLSKIKKEFTETFIAFGGGGSKLLGHRDDIDELAVIALESGNQNLLQMFEQPMPTLNALKKNKTDAELKAFVPSVEVKNEVVKAPEVEEGKPKK